MNIIRILKLLSPDIYLQPNVINRLRPHSFYIKLKLKGDFSGMKTSLVACLFPILLMKYF